ncbi:hypothetical protein [Plantactinospora sp. KBS50]|uniref:hypothetical protein n=1 Tax=Plantactinospora sp. KBS50 TaxID=2024580 RepID=UPI000BAAE5F7|nr:hypothetical protein [Plantactinospora sp. KBS50]ASW53041.1 hypothetical protein CIK06_00820 [Plantactinospora sp. KBS50]
MYDVVLLALGSDRPAPGGCGSGVCCGAGTGEVDPRTGAADARAGDPHPAGADDACAAGPGTGDACADAPRVPVLACADALSAAGARVSTVTARSDAEIDAVLARLDGPPRADGLAWPDDDGKTRLVVAAASDGQLRAVLRRLVRRYAPPPSRRPADLAGNRTVADLPAIGLLPLEPARATGSRPADLIAQLGLPRTPAEVARAVLAGRVRRLDLLRNDGGSVTLDGALIGGADETGAPRPWQGRVEVDGTVLSTGDEGVLACVVGNAGGYAEVEGAPLLRGADPADGLVEVAVAVPVLTRSGWTRRRRVRLEIRRGRGRAVAINPRTERVPYLDDGVAGELTRKRSWWVEPGAWAVFDPDGVG